MRHGFTFTVLALGFAALVGCTEDLPQATEVVHMRILGAKLEVVGDPTRSTPKPGESVQATFATVFPSPTRTNMGVQAMLVGCTAPEMFTGGLPVCQEFLAAASGEVGADVGAAIDIAQDQTDPMDVAGAMGSDAKLSCEDLPMPKIRAGQLSIQCLRGDPVAVFDVAKNFKADRMLFIGVVCETGTAFIDPTDPLIFGCDNNKGETTRVNGLITVQHNAAEANHNPTAEHLEMVLETFTELWLPPEGELPPANACHGKPSDPFDQADQMKPLTLPQADPGRHDILLAYDASAREQFEGEPEDLEITIFTTAGEMERRFTLWGGDVEPDKAGKLVESVEWEPPPFKDLPPEDKGKLVRFFVTLRDHRGGFDMTTRAACIH